MTLGATLTATLATQQMELTREAFVPGASEGAKAVSELVDRLDSRLGSGAVRRPRLVESHVPERAFALAPAGADEGANDDWQRTPHRSEEHTSELQSLMRISYAVFCLKKKNTRSNHTEQRTLRSNHYR